MHTLFLDLASHSQLIALVQDDQVAGSAMVDSKADESQLLPLIEGMLSKAKITFKDLDRIASTTGPGGFMSLRVGTALANALSDTLKIPLAGVHLSEVWRERVASDQPFEAMRPSGPNGWTVGSVLWLHSTKREALFIKGFGDHEKKWREPEYITLSDLQSALLTTHDSLPTSYVGELLDSQQAALPQLQKAKQLRNLDEVLPALLAALTYEMKPLEPWYGRGA